MLCDWNFWLSLITAIVAIIAIFQTAHQTKLSNRQHLFDRRLDAYMHTLGLIDLCKGNVEYLQPDRNEDVFWENDSIFIFLTNNSFMEEQADAIKHPLEQPYHADFLRKCEELDNLACELSIIFQGKTVISYSDFVVAYKETLFSMYQYQILINKMSEFTKTQPICLTDVQEKFKEPKQRQQLFNSIKKLIETYQSVQVEEGKETLKKQLSLN